MDEDDVDVFYTFEGMTDTEDLRQTIMEYEEMIKRAIHTMPKDVVQWSESTENIIWEEHDIVEVQFTLTLLRL